MLTELRGRVDELGENFTKEKENMQMEIENTKRNQSEMKNPLENINSRWEEAEDQISD